MPTRKSGRDAVIVLFERETFARLQRVEWLRTRVPAAGEQPGALHGAVSMSADGRRSVLQENDCNPVSAVSARLRARFRAVVSLFLFGLVLLAVPAHATTFVAGSTFADNNTDTVVVPTPAGVAEGDVMVVQLSYRDSSTGVTAPAGWSVIRSDVGGDLAQIAYFRVAVAGEPASHTWTLPARTRVLAINAAYRNVDTVDPVDAHSGQAGSGSAVVAPSITTSIANTRLLGLFSAAQGSSAFASQPPGMVTRANLNIGGGPNGVRGLLADEIVADDGATGDRAADAGVNSVHVGQLIALRPATAGVAAQVRFSVQPSETTLGQVISPAVEVRIEDIDGNLVSDSTAEVTVAIENNPGGGTLSGTTTVNAVNGIATFDDLSIDQTGDGYTLRATATDLDPDISDPFNIVPPEQEANAFDTDTPAGEVTGNIGTKVAGLPFALDIVAIEDGQPAQPDNNEDFAAALLDASDNSGTLDAVNCRDSWTVIQDLGAFDFNDGTNDGRTTLTGIQENESWRQVRVRIERTFPPGQSGLVGCSNDAFAIRPDALIEVQASDTDPENPGTARVLDNTDPASSPVHVAGAPFTLRARAVNALGNTTTNYAGTPVAEIACIAAGAPCVDGTLDPGTWTANSGVIESNSGVYDEAGALELTLVDEDFAAVDAGDSTDNERFIRSDAAVDVGRFIPADFLVEIADDGDLEATCNSTFTYTGEAAGYVAGMEPELTITARNVAGATTVNYSGDYARLTAADVDVDGPIEDGSETGLEGDPVSVTSALDPGTLIANGDGTLTHTFANTDRFTYDKVNNARTNPFGPDLDLDVTAVVDADGVAADPSILPLTVEPAAVHEIRFGRLVVESAAGSELAPIEQPVRTEYWNADTWQTHTADDCTALTLAGEVQLNNDQGGPVDGTQPIPVGGGNTDLTTNTPDPLPLASGAAVMTFAAPGEANTGWVDTTLTLGADLPWLRHDWDDADGAGDGPYDDLPTGRVTFGIHSGNTNWIHFRRTQ